VFFVAGVAFVVVLFLRSGRARLERMWLLPEPKA
jgi:hypothetical protein